MNIFILKYLHRRKCNFNHNIRIVLFPPKAAMLFCIDFKKEETIILIKILDINLENYEFFLGRTWCKRVIYFWTNLVGNICKC